MYYLFKKCLFAIMIIGFPLPMLAMEKQLKERIESLSTEKKPTLKDNFKSIILMSGRPMPGVTYELIFFTQKEGIPLTTINKLQKGKNEKNVKSLLEDFNLVVNKGKALSPSILNNLKIHANEFSSLFFVKNKLTSLNTVVSIIDYDLDDLLKKIKARNKFFVTMQIFPTKESSYCKEPSYYKKLLSYCTVS